MLKNPPLSMDDLKNHHGDLFIVVEPDGIPFSRITTSYVEAKSLQHKYTTNGLLIMLTHDTIQEILKNPDKEVVI